MAQFHRGATGENCSLAMAVGRGAGLERHVAASAFGHSPAANALIEDGRAVHPFHLHSAKAAARHAFYHGLRLARLLMVWEFPG